MDLSVDGRACVDALVKYLYTLKYTAFPSDAPPWDHAKTVEYHVRMCVMADKYDIKPLKNMAIHAFNDKIESEVAIIELSKAACIAQACLPAERGASKYVSTQKGRRPLRHRSRVEGGAAHCRASSCESRVQNRMGRARCVELLLLTTRL